MKDNSRDTINPKGWEDFKKENKEFFAKVNKFLPLVGNSETLTKQFGYVTKQSKVYVIDGVPQIHFLPEGFKDGDDCHQIHGFDNITKTIEMLMPNVHYVTIDDFADGMPKIPLIK